MAYPLPLVRRLVLHFLDLAGWEGDRALITLSKRTYDRAAFRSGEEPLNEGEYFGVALVRYRPEPDPMPVIWINPDIQDVTRLARTCAHEALHAARPTMRHGRSFDRAITRMLRGVEP